MLPIRYAFDSWQTGYDFELHHACCIISPVSCLHRQTQRKNAGRSEGRWSTCYRAGLWSLWRQLDWGRAERNKVWRPSVYTNLVNGNWLLLVTSTGPGTKSSGFSIKQCQILMIFLFPASRMNSLILAVVLMNVCYCLAACCLSVVIFASCLWGWTRGIFCISLPLHSNTKEA